jgi:hypothetical protein
MPLFLSQAQNQGHDSLTFAPSRYNKLMKIKMLYKSIPKSTSQSADN